jgi:hypothetical protein
MCFRPEKYAHHGVEARIDSAPPTARLLELRRLIFELASGQLVNRREDALFLGPPGSVKSHLARVAQRSSQVGNRPPIEAHGSRVSNAFNSNAVRMRSQRLEVFRV